MTSHVQSEFYRGIGQCLLDLGGVYAGKGGVHVAEPFLLPSICFFPYDALPTPRIFLSRKQVSALLT